MQVKKQIERKKLTNYEEKILKKIAPILRKF